MLKDNEVLTVHRDPADGKLVFNFDGSGNEAIEVIGAIVEGILDCKLKKGDEEASCIAFCISTMNKIDEVLKTALGYDIEFVEDVDDESSRQES